MWSLEVPHDGNNFETAKLLTTKGFYSHDVSEREKVDSVGNN
jgi:hypothetical protein